MPKAVPILSQFHNLTPGDLADQLGTLKAEVADLEAREKSLRDELIRRGETDIDGAVYRASITQGIRWTLNTQLVKEEMGLAWVRRALPPAIGYDGFGEADRRRRRSTHCSVKEGGSMANAMHRDDHTAGLYRAMALRFYSRYVDMRHSAEFHGGDVADHGPLPTKLDAEETYNAAVEGWLWENPDSAAAAMALIEFADLLAADRLVGEAIREPVNDQRDAYHQSVALAAVAGWLNQQVTNEFVERKRAAAGNAGIEIKQPDGSIGIYRRRRGTD